MTEDLTMEELYERIATLDTQDKKEMSFKLVKLMEEVGEIAEAFLEYDGYKRSGKSKTECKENILEECSDALLMIYSILNVNGNSLEEIKEMINKKCNKWESNLD
jgi:NTP pyrophosphatase (non-canonical NTP hydrolase)